MKMTVRSHIVLATMLLVAPTLTFAGFEMVDSPAAPVQVVKEPVNRVVVAPVQTVATNSTAPMKRSVVSAPTDSILIGGINHVGRKPAILPPAKGFAKSVPLRDALSMLVPASIDIFNDGQINLNTLVSWSGSDADDWAGVLGGLLRSLGIAATLDWNNHSLTLDQQKTIPVAAAPAPTWKLLASDKTVRKAFSRWAKDANWHIDWDIAVDYPIPYDTAYSGSFTNAVEQVLISLGGSDYPPEACTYDNNAIRVVRLGEANRCKLQPN